ncbi:hypothetical protein Tco_1414182, partial [Tanacetum coccineum]
MGTATISFWSLLPEEFIKDQTELRSYPIFLQVGYETYRTFPLRTAYDFFSSKRTESVFQNDLTEIQDNTFNGAIGENVFEHINKLLEVVGPIKINEVSQDQVRLSIFPISLAGAAGEWFKKECLRSVTSWDDLIEKFVQKFYQLSDHNEEIEKDDDPDNITDIFKIEGNLFDFETPLCEAFNDFNYLLKIDKDLFTFDIQGIGTYEEYELNNPMTRDHEEPWLDNGVPYQL